MQKISPRTILGLMAVFCFGLLATVWFLQYGPDKQQPCPLCVLQRYAMILIGITALIGAIHPRIGYALGTALFAVGGLAMAIWQVLKGAEMLSCKTDPIGIFVNGLPTANWWPEYFFATGGCADKYSVLGLPVPVWSLICFFLLMVVTLVAIIKMRRPH